MTAEAPQPLITRPYLIILNVALKSADGRLWADPLWHKDLLLHLIAIDRITLACPVERGPVPADWLPIEDSRVTVVPLPPMTRRSVLYIPFIAYRLRKIIRPGMIVHTGVAGWPYPLGWIASVVARMRGAFLLINVESAFWRTPVGRVVGPWERFKAAFWEKVNSALLNAADLTFFTTEEYRSSLLHHPRGPSYVQPATWVDPEQLISFEDLAAMAPAREGRFLFAGRLTGWKGVNSLLDAIERTQAKVDLIGTGDLLERARSVAAQFPDRVRVLDPVPYGKEFSALLDRYAAILVPTLSDEQPRILFDAFARGLAAIASDTSGNLQLVRDGIDGWVIPAGDTSALASALERATADPSAVAALGRAARATMDDRTHEAMHRTRGNLIAKSLESDARATPSPGEHAVSPGSRT